MVAVTKGAHHTMAVEHSTTVEIVDPDDEPRPAPLPAPRPTPGGAPVGLFGTSDPVQTIERATATATALTRVIEDRNLFVAMGHDADGHERRHVIIEGWQLLGAMMGVTTHTEWTRPVTDPDGQWSPPAVRDVERTLHSKWCNNRSCPGIDKPADDGCKTYTKLGRETVDAGHGGWEARVIATRTSDSAIMGAAESECRWDEPHWADRDSYALRSMAQTRASSKAYSNALRFVVTLAGFSGTPAEEMEGVRDANTGGATPAGPTYDDPFGVPDDMFRCPACGDAVWDNRPANIERIRDGKNRMPPFKCRNRSCGGTIDDGDVVTEGAVGEPWITWSDAYFWRRVPAVVAAMRAVFEHVDRDAEYAKFVWEDTAQTMGMDDGFMVPIDRLDEFVATIVDTIPGIKPPTPIRDTPTERVDVPKPEWDVDPSTYTPGDGGQQGGNDTLPYDDDDPERPF